MLTEIAAYKREEMASFALPSGDLTVCSNDFRQAIQQPLQLIAEIKPKSPSAGELSGEQDLLSKAQAYQQAGAACLSILTDRYYFGGSFALLAKIAHQVSVPILCKDIIVSRKQIDWARFSGASACLLIVKALSQEELVEFIAHIEQYQMTAVVEVNTQAELERAQRAGASVILINHRDLFKVIKSLFFTK